MSELNPPRYVGMSVLYTQLLSDATMVWAIGLYTDVDAEPQICGEIAVEASGKMRVKFSIDEDELGCAQAELRSIFEEVFECAGELREKMFKCFWWDRNIRLIAAFNARLREGLDALPFDERRGIEETLKDGSDLRNACWKEYMQGHLKGPVNWSYVQDFYRKPLDLHPKLPVTDLIDFED